MNWQSASMATMVSLLFAASAAIAQDADKNGNERVHIYGIAGVRIYVSGLPASRRFYKTITDADDRHCDLCETTEPEPAAFRFGSGQFLLLSQAPTDHLKNEIAEITFTADNLKLLKKKLQSQKMKIATEKEQGEIVVLRTFDPEGHSLAFVQKDVPIKLAVYHTGQASDTVLNEQIIHAGFVVHDRSTMDKFYRDLLGFHLYWYGGMKDGDTDWVDMQVPDGTDWIEYMLNVPADADARTRGVMNHVALGVRSVEAADKALLDEKLPDLVAEQPEIGRDGKWQLNLYDPDLTRVELMEFAPVRKPCCGEFTGAHPKSWKNEDIP
jgi:catechol 2,3-dioxygenase-like lactoylglutathione lyase family enzyme